MRTVTSEQPRIIDSVLTRSTGSVRRAQQREHGKDTAVRVGRCREAELHEDLSDVGLNGALVDRQTVADRAVGPAFGHETEYFRLTARQLAQPTASAPATDDPRDDRRIDHRLAIDDAAECIDERGDVHDSILQ